MLNDLIWVGVQFAKIDCQPKHVLLQLWRQVEDKQKFQNIPKKVGVRFIEEKKKNTNKNIEDLEDLSGRFHSFQ